MFNLDQTLWAYEKSLLIRRFEEKAAQLYGLGTIGGFCHLYIGQEAVVVASKMAAKDQDSFITSYRDHGHMLVCDMDPKFVMAELTGRMAGYSKGKGGSMHMFSKEKRFYGGHGIVGAQVSLGTGLGFAHKYLNDCGVSLVFLGDGAMNQGQTFESLNMASLWNLPVLYIIENNGYAIGTSQSRCCAGSDLFKRGEPFGIKGSKIDGMDTEKIHEVMVEYLAEIRKGRGPRILECQTYRYRGHSMSDPAQYRAKEEVDNYKDRDPLKILKAKLIELKQEDSINKIEKKIKQTVQEAADFAENAPEPPAAELWTDVLL